LAIGIHVLKKGCWGRRRKRKKRREKKREPSVGPPINLSYHCPFIFRR